MENHKKVFPVINLSPVLKYMPWKEEFEKKFLEDSSILKLSQEISEAFTDWGFIYIKNHGIDENCISNAYQTSEKFFKLNEEEKKLVTRKNDGEDWGYVPFNVETFEKERPFDVKECFNFLPVTDNMDLINGIAPPNFIQNQTSLFNACHDLSVVFMYLLSLQLPVDNINYLYKNHSKVGKFNENATILRLLHYPSISHKEEVKENQLRCGEHSDYGTFTFLFQNGEGLQVVNPAGKYVDATPIPGTIVVNSGDMLEIWSSGKFKSTKHRVLLPKKLDEARQSIAYFSQPDNEITISCLDGSNKYEAVNPFKYLLSKFAEIYS